MNLEQYQAKLKELATLSSEQVAQSILVPAANALLAAIKNRIALDGKNTAGSNIGKYGTKESYYSKEQFTKTGSFKAQGKTGDRKFKNGQPHKTMYLGSGYKELREVQGKQSDKMNLNYSGSTLLSYQLRADGEVVLLGLVNERASNIKKWQEEKRGRIFYAGSEELNAYNKEVSEQSALLTKRILGA